jgi:hypothetical protein
MRLVTVFIVTFLLPFPINIAKATTLGELTRRCEQLESFWRVHPGVEGQISIPYQADPAVCFGYARFYGLEKSIFRQP